MVSRRKFLSCIGSLAIITAINSKDAICSLIDYSQEEVIDSAMRRYLSESDLVFRGIYAGNAIVYDYTLKALCTRYDFENNTVYKKGERIYLKGEDKDNQSIIRVLDDKVMPGSYPPNPEVSEMIKDQVYCHYIPAPPDFNIELGNKAIVFSKVIASKKADAAILFAYAENENSLRIFGSILRTYLSKK
jgi:hypothetical protein